MKARMEKYVTAPEKSRTSKNEKLYDEVQDVLSGKKIGIDNVFTQRAVNATVGFAELQVWGIFTEVDIMIACRLHYPLAEKACSKGTRRDKQCCDGYKYFKNYFFHLLCSLWLFIHPMFACRIFHRAQEQT